MFICCQHMTFEVALLSSGKHVATMKSISNLCVATTVCVQELIILVKYFLSSIISCLHAEAGFGEDIIHFLTC